MIDLDTAKKLKESGMTWDPQVGHAYGMVNQLKSTDSADSEIRDIVVSSGELFSNLGRVAGLKGLYPRDSVYWIPSLSDMLNEVNKMGFSWNLSPDGFQLVNKQGMLKFVLNNFKNDNQEQAVADGLLWLYQSKSDS